MSSKTASSKFKSPPENSRHPTFGYISNNLFDVIADIVEGLGIAARKIAVDMGAYICTGSYLSRLQTALPKADLVDATDLLGSFQFVKSEVELVHMRNAAVMAEADLEAAGNTLETGMIAIQYCRKTETAMRDLGSEYPALPSLYGSDGRGPGMHSIPTNKKIENRKGRSGAS